MTLDDLVGTWQQTTSFGGPPGTVTFEWALDGKYLLQRSTIPDPVPDSIALIAPDGDGWLQHYYDARGVTRLYRMTLADGVWTLLRTEPDFSPLDFAQRFTGTLSDDKNRIDGHWEQSHDGGATWELDFTLACERAPRVG